MRTIAKYSNDIDFKVGPVPRRYSAPPGRNVFLTKWNVPSRGPNIKSISISFEYSDGTLRIKMLKYQSLRIKGYDSKVNKSGDVSKGELSMVKMRTKAQNNKYSNDMDFRIGPVPGVIFTTARAEWLV